MLRPTLPAANTPTLRVKFLASAVKKLRYSKVMMSAVLTLIFSLKKERSLKTPLITAHAIHLARQVHSLLATAVTKPSMPQNWNASALAEANGVSLQMILAVPTYLLPTHLSTLQQRPTVLAGLLKIPSKILSALAVITSNTRIPLTAPAEKELPPSLRIMILAVKKLTSCLLH
jgi:hypothetical protein